MKNRSLARFVVFALIQVVLCVLAFVFAAGISSSEPEFQTDGSKIGRASCRERV